MTPIPHNRLTFGAAERDAVAAAVTSGQWACGPMVARFERDLSRHAGRAHTVAVGSGLGALRLALLSLRVGTGDEVIIPAYSCVALANAVLACGARPVAVDVSPTAWVIAVPGARAAIGPRTKAIIAVHTFGAGADIAALAGLGPPVIEDCAHGFAARGTGASPAIAVTSLHATKLIGAGEGGAVLTDDADCADFVRRWRDYGDQPANGTRLNDKMSDISAALARCQLERLESMIAAREARAGRYQRAFRSLGQAGKMHLPAWAERIWYRYPVEFAAHSAPDAIDLLAKRGVSAAQPVHDWRTGGSGGCPVADRAFGRVVSLPLYPTLTDDEQDTVIDAVREIAGGAP